MSGGFCFPWWNGECCSLFVVEDESAFLVRYWTTGDNGHHQELKCSLEPRGQSQCTKCGVDSAANRKNRIRIKPVACRSWIQLLSHWFVSWQLCVINFWSGMASYLHRVCISDSTFHIENEIILMMLSVSLVKWLWSGLVWPGVMMWPGQWNVLEF